jgi:hypothetical protein
MNKPVPLRTGTGKLGRGMGSPGKPQGYPCQALIMASFSVSSILTTWLMSKFLIGDRHRDSTTVFQHADNP